MADDTANSTGDARAVVVGATGGIGRALVSALGVGGRFSAVRALSRSGEPVPGATESGAIDVTDEASVRAAAAALAGGAPVRLVLIASGVLHGPSLAPEKSLAALDPEAMLGTFAINAVGPALVIKHVFPLLPRRGRSVVAALSARVGSIGDNRLGGWHAYRASKAALNMLLRGAAIELARTRPEALCVGLHPGTVRTALSAPFEAGVAAGRLFEPGFAAARLLAVLDGLSPAQSGRVFAWDGAEVPP